MPKTLFDKIWDQHAVLEEGGESMLWLDRVLLHERTGAIALSMLEERGAPVRRRESVFCVVDHIVSTLPGRGIDDARMPGGDVFIRSLREASRRAGLTLFDTDDPRQGIVHVIAPELGIALPGCTVVCADSHTCTLGGIGALAWGIGSSETAQALATGALWLRRPPVMRVRCDGRLRAGASAKDLALHLIGAEGARGGSGYAIEFAGEAIADMEVEARMTLCNLAVEFAAFSALIAPDERVVSWLRDRPWAPSGADWEAAVAHWRTLRSDAAASFDAELVVDCARVAPMTTWGTSPEHALPVDGAVPDPATIEDAGRRAAAERALRYMGLRPGQAIGELAIDAAFIGSCTNSRLGDLRAAARVLRGRRVAPGLRAICAPGSTQVKRAAEAEGLDRVFTEAGFEWRESGCAMCFYAGGETFAPGQRVITSTNRNFEGRQGPGCRSHLASPATVAASALAGRIVAAEA